MSALIGYAIFQRKRIVPFVLMHVEQPQGHGSKWMRMQEWVPLFVQTVMRLDKEEFVSSCLSSSCEIKFDFLFLMIFRTLCFLFLFANFLPTNGAGQWRTMLIMRRLNYIWNGVDVRFAGMSNYVSHHHHHNTFSSFINVLLFMLAPQSVG